MSFRHVLTKSANGVETITLNRPDKRNALSAGMMRELLDAFKTLGQDRQVQAIVLAGNGPAFSAGHDLSELVGGDINGGVQDFWQLFTRPTARLVPYTTPVKGLYLCSSSTPPGGGVHGMSGYFAARWAIRSVLAKK